MDRFDQPLSKEHRRKPLEDELADYKEQETERMIERLERKELNRSLEKLRDPIGD